MWSGPGREADDVIEDLIGKASDPRRLLVVSSDRRLRKAAKRRRCKWLDSESFLRTILEDVARGTALADPPPPDTDDWVAQFGLGGADIAALEAEADAADFGHLIPAEAGPQPAAARPAPTPDDSEPREAPIAFPADVLEQARRIAGDA